MLPAAFSHRSEPQRTPEGTPRPFARCGLADGLFDHPRVEFFSATSRLSLDSTWLQACRP